MPLYDFDCPSCETTFEALAPPGESAPCPACGAAEVRRRYAAPATAKIGLTGAAAARSNAERRVREERRQEGFRAQRERPAPGS